MEENKINLLAIETTGAKASAALIHEDGRLALRESDETMNHLQNLIPMLEALLADCGLTIDDVTAIAVSEGPGSFTGIRIGMATAKALAQVLSVPVIGVPTLESFAYHVPESDGLICPIFDARRSQVYGGVYRWEKGVCRSMAPDGAYDVPEYLELLQAAVLTLWEEAESVPGVKQMKITLFGDGIKLYGQEIEKAMRDWNSGTDRLSEKGDFTWKVAEEANRLQSAASVARLGLRLLKEGKAKSLFDLHPVYLRKAEAQRKLDEAQGKGGEKPSRQAEEAGGLAGEPLPEGDCLCKAGNGAAE